MLQVHPCWCSDDIWKSNSEPSLGLLSMVLLLKYMERSRCYMLLVWQRYCTLCPEAPSNCRQHFTETPRKCETCCHSCFASIFFLFKACLSQSGSSLQSQQPPLGFSVTMNGNACLSCTLVLFALGWKQLPTQSFYFFSSLNDYF